MLNILNINSNFWSEVSTSYRNGLTESGYTLFTNGSAFKRVAYSNGVPLSGYEYGFTKIADIPPTKGLTNNGGKILQPQNAQLAALSESLGLDWTDGVGNMVLVEYGTIKKYITHPSYGTVVNNHISQINIVNYKQLLNNRFCFYNNNHYWRDMDGENDVRITNNRVLSFNGVNQYASCGNLGTLTQYTIEIKFKSTEVINYRNIFDTNFAGGENGLRIEQQTGNKLFIQSGNASGSTAFQLSSTFQPNTDYTLVISCDGTRLVFRLNNFKTSWSCPYLAQNFSDLALGVGFGTSRCFKGDIYSFKICNSYRPYDLPFIAPVLSYLFKESAGAVLYNIASNNNHATINNYNETMWANVNDNIEQSLFTNGYEAYENNAYPNDKTKFIFVPLVIGVELTPSIAGYTKKYTVPANVGISDVGSKFTGIKFSELALTYDEIVGYINNVPNEQFNIDNSGDIITDMMSIKL